MYASIYYYRSLFCFCIRLLPNALLSWSSISFQLWLSFTFTFWKELQLFLLRSATLEHVSIHFLISPSHERGELELGELIWESWHKLPHPYVEYEDSTLIRITSSSMGSQSWHCSRHCTRVWVQARYLNRHSSIEFWPKIDEIQMSHSCVTARLDWRTENATISCVSSRRSRNMIIES